MKHRRPSSPARSTGASDTTGKSDKVPVTPEQIADAAIEAAKAGAAVAHLHVRDPETGKGSRDVGLFSEAVDRVKASGVDVVINLTAGMGGDFVPDENDPTIAGPGSDLIGPKERLAHVEAIRPEICSLDCGTMNFGNGNETYVNTAGFIRQMAAGHQRPWRQTGTGGPSTWVKFAWPAQLVAEGLVSEPPLFQVCLGIPWGAGADTRSMTAMVDNLPAGANWGGFLVSAACRCLWWPRPCCWAAMCVSAWRIISIWIAVSLASNGDLVARAVEIIERLGGKRLDAGRSP